jgi:hypothetical protein
VAYYRTEEGKIKKQLQNSKRSRVVSVLEQEKMTEGKLAEAQHGTGMDKNMVLYLAMVTSLIEGRVVRKEEILEVLKRAVRQHSMVRRRKVDYLVWRLNKDPP